jgi:SAM-dependent methyltransferase
MNIDDHTKEAFESQWAINNLETLIASCPQDELYPTFEKYLKPGIRILESGCGQGKWVFHYHRRGFDITGLDWSQKTINFINHYDREVKVVKGDARDSGFGPDEFDLVLSLGTIEHAVEGPEQALADAYRVLKAGGVMIVTVPILTPVRRAIYAFKAPFKLLLSLVHVFAYKIRRQSFKSLSSIVDKPKPGLYAWAIKDKDGYHFFEYRFPLKKLVSYVEKAGFEIIESFPAYRQAAIHHDLSPFAGKWDYVNGDPNLNWFGRTIEKLFGGHFSHMAVCVARKKAVLK